MQETQKAASSLKHQNVFKNQSFKQSNLKEKDNDSRCASIVSFSDLFAGVVYTLHSCREKEGGRRREKKGQK